MASITICRDFGAQKNKVSHCFHCFPIYLPWSDISSQNYGFSNNHVWMWELDYKESWMPKNWCFWTVMFEKCTVLRVPWTARRSNQSILKEINPEYSLEGLMLKLKLEYFGHFSHKSRLIGKDPGAGKDWRQEKGITENEMVRWHHWLYGHEFEQALGDGEGQGSIVFCNPWGHKESDKTEQLNNNSNLYP